MRRRLAEVTLYYNLLITKKSLSALLLVKVSNTYLCQTSPTRLPPLYGPFLRAESETSIVLWVMRHCGYMVLPVGESLYRIRGISLISWC